MPERRYLMGHFVRRFLIEEMGADRNLSPNTQKSYRDTIRLLFRYVGEHHGAEPVRVTVEQVDATVVRGFLAHLEHERGNATSTRNLRLTALHSLFRFIARQAPELVDHAATIEAIPPRRTTVPAMAYLEKHEIDAMLSVPDRARAQGRRDYALLLFLYNTGARASEAARVSVADLAPDIRSVRLDGKGRKVRTCPLWSRTAEVLRELLGPRIDGPREAPVFLNVHGRPITRYGIHGLVVRTANKAAETVPSLRVKRVSPHTVRHATAVHLLRAGVDINTIRAWLGHVSLETTNRYAEVDLEMKAKALQMCADDGMESMHDGSPSWHSDGELMTFLASL